MTRNAATKAYDCLSYGEIERKQCIREKGMGKEIQGWNVFSISWSCL